MSAICPMLLLAAAEGTNTQYEYLQPGGIAFNLSLFIIGLLLGGLLACILTVFHHALVGRFFRALIAHRAFSRESSKTLAELDMARAFGFRAALRSPASLVRKLVTAVLPDGTVVPPIHSLDDDIAAEEAKKSAIHAEEGPIVHGEEDEDRTAAAPLITAEPMAEPAATPTVIDPMTAAYYLDDVHRRRAELRFSRRGNEFRLLIPTVIIFLAAAATLPLYLPHIVKFMDTLISAILGG